MRATRAARPPLLRRHPSPKANTAAPAGGDLFARYRARPAVPRKRQSARPAAEGATRPTASRAPRFRSPPRARRRRAKLPFDRSKYQTIRSLDELNAWIARVHDVGHFAIDAKANSIDPMQAEMCGIALALGAQRRLLCPAQPQAIRRRRRPVRRRPRAGPDQGQRRARGAAAAAGIGRHPEDRLQHQVQRRDVRAAWRHHPQPRRRAADVLCARCRPQCAWARCAGRALARPRHHQLWRDDRQRQEQAQLRSGRDRQGDGLFGRETPM